MGVLFAEMAADPFSSVNLTDGVAADWIHYDAWTGYNHMSGGNGELGAPTLLGTTVQATYAFFALSESWADGTPTASAIGDTSGISSNNTGPAAAGNGIKITCTADTKWRTVFIHWGCYNGSSQIVLSLSDGSAASVTLTRAISAGITAYNWTKVTFAANSASQTLNASITMTATSIQTDTNISLQSAELIYTPQPRQTLLGVGG